MNYVTFMVGRILDCVITRWKQMVNSRDASDTGWVVIWSPDEDRGDVVLLDWFKKERERVFLSSRWSHVQLGEVFSTKEEARRFLARELKRKTEHNYGEAA